MAVDVEQLVSAFLRDQDDVTDLVGDRVWTVLAKDAVYPNVVLTRVFGAPTSPHIRYHDRAFIQIDVRANTKKQAFTINDTVLAALEDLTGSHDEGIVTGVDFGDYRWLPDPDFTPAKPRYVSDVQVYTHPAPVAQS